MPAPVTADAIDCLRFPVVAKDARPEPMAPVRVGLNPAKTPPNVPAPAKLLNPILPSNGAKKGRNASGCPVMGFLVREPVGDREANP